MQWVHDQFVIDDDRARLDVPRIMGWLAESYWAGWRPPAEVRTSWDAAAIVLGLYDGQEMIGCARVVSDFTRFSYLSDVFVDPHYRGLGLMEQYKPVILDKMRRMGFADIDKHIVVDRTLSPAGIEKEMARVRVARKTANHASHHLLLRPKGYASFKYRSTNSKFLCRKRPAQLASVDRMKSGLR